jgi:prevent-host-death family protein
MTTVNIHEAKTHLSRLLDRVAAGEEIIIAKAGTPVARLVSLAPRAAPRKPGHLKITLPDSFFDPLPDDELEAWGQ